MAAHALLIKAARCIEQARALDGEFTDKSQIPADVARRIDALLGEATKYRNQVRREAAMTEMDGWLREPDYGGSVAAAAFDDDAGRIGGKMAIPGIDGIHSTDAPGREATASKVWFQWVRAGKAGLTPEQKAALVEDAQGEVLIPPDFAGTILRELPRMSVIRNLAFIRPTSSNKVDVGVVNIASAGWGKLETGTAAADGLAADPADKDTISVHDLNALVKIGVDELEDSDEDLGGVIAQALTLKIAEMEDDAFANGTGTDRPRGVAQATTITQGVAAAAGQVVTGDELKRVTFQVPAQFRKSSNAAWIGHTSAEEKIALLKDADGRYLLQPNTAAGEPDTLMGYRWYTCDGLPAITATNDVGAGTDKSVIFGDFRQGYMVAQRRQATVKRLEERYADEGKIGLLFRHRVGGDVIRPKAFAWLKL